jgi:hypothetical protein
MLVTQEKKRNEKADSIKMRLGNRRLPIRNLHNHPHRTFQQ